MFVVCCLFVFVFVFVLLPQKPRLPTWLFREHVLEGGERVQDVLHICLRVSKRRCARCDFVENLKINKQQTNYQKRRGITRNRAALAPIYKDIYSRVKGRATRAQGKGGTTEKSFKNKKTKSQQTKSVFAMRTLGWRSQPNF